MSKASKKKDGFHECGKRFLLAARWFTIVSTGGCALVQLSFVRNYSDVAALLLMFAGSILLSLRLQSHLFRNAPLSNLMLIGTGATFLYLPLVIKSLLFEGATRDLDRPLSTIFYAFVFFLCMAIAHHFYLKSTLLSSIKKTIQNTLARGHIFDTPTNGQLWIMGLFGITSTFLLRFGSGGSEGIVSKLLSGFTFLSFAPLIAFVAPLMHRGSKVTKTAKIVVLIYSIALFAIAMSSGSRSYFVLGFVNLALAYFIGWSLGFIKFSLLKPVTVIVVGVAALIAYKPLIYTFKAAQAATERDKTVTFQQRFDKFLDILGDPDFVESQQVGAQRDRERMMSRGVMMWDEAYFENEFFNRLINLKYHDLLFGCISDFDEAQVDRLTAISSRRILCILPGPVLEFSNVDFDKTEILSSSMGDYIWNEATHDGYSLRAFRTGSLHADAYLHFRWFYGLALALMAVPIFLVSDSLTMMMNAGGRMLPKFSALGLLSLLSMFTTFGSASGVESISSIISLSTRGFIQDALIYAAVFWALSIFAGSTSKRSNKGRRGVFEKSTVEDKS